jgi:hypothetical protein
MYQQLPRLLSIRYNPAKFVPYRFRARTPLDIGGSHAQTEADWYRAAN